MGLHLKLIWITLSYFAFLWLHQFLSSVATRSLWTLCRSIRQIKAPYVFDGNVELLCMQCRGIGPHLTERGNCHDFSRVAAGTWRIFSSYGGDETSKLVFVQ